MDSLSMHSPEAIFSVPMKHFLQLLKHDVNTGEKKTGPYNERETTLLECGELEDLYGSER